MLAGAHAGDVVDRHDPHLAVTDLAGLGRADDRVRHRGDVGVRVLLFIKTRQIWKLYLNGNLLFKINFLFSF